MLDDNADLPEIYKGLYVESKTSKAILVSRKVKLYTEKICILAEELGHYHTTVGNILDQSKLPNRKKEMLARQWAYQKLVPLSAIVQAHKTGIRNKHELADMLDITEDFLDSSLKRYQEKYGLWVKVEQYTICFEPLGVLEMFEF